jgi:hypothetical protein
MNLKLVHALLFFLVSCGSSSKKENPESEIQDILIDIPSDTAEIENEDLTKTDGKEFPDAQEEKQEEIISEIIEVKDSSGKDQIADIKPEEITSDSCSFNYNFKPWDPPSEPVFQPDPQPVSDSGSDKIVHPEPDPPSYSLIFSEETRAEIIIPDYADTMPLFPRAKKWDTETRCYETPSGVKYLTEEEAWQMYKDIAEKTTGIQVDTKVNVRSVLGIRGAYPGTFAWNGNTANRFNDTMVLFWKDGNGNAHVREFPVNTEPGPVDFGWHASSHLRANRRYHYINGWHKNYNALEIYESDYMVRDETNKNGHWDSDRNEWLPPEGAKDHDRTGNAHNIHAASVDSPLGSAEVDSWSAGCQTIPGIKNWIEFITSAWTKENDKVNYYLVDARDIDPSVWNPCTPDGSHECPFHIPKFAFSAEGDTGKVTAGKFGKYNCSDADESGPEIVYYFTFDEIATLSVVVEDDASNGIDIDIHLLDGDDKNACIIRDNTSFSQEIWPGRYFIITDTFVKDGKAQKGAFKLSAWIE